MSALLQVSGVSKRFPRATRDALQNVEFDVLPGELVALVGASGSGKTSLLRILAGLEVPDSGEIHLDGAVLTSKRRMLVPPEKRHMGFVFQNHALFPHLNVRQNVGFGLDRSQEARRTVDELLNLVGLEHYAERYPHELSGGERQRAALARALAPNPRLLLMDEPFSSLDETLRETLRDETRALVRQRETTTILVTHHTADALAVADRIIVLKDGIVQQVGTPAEIYSAPANRYIADSFGACNFIQRTDLSGPCREVRGIEPNTVANDELWLRPEGITIGEESSERSITRGVVTDFQFMGEGQMLTLACEASDGASFSIRVRYRGQRGVSVGDAASLVLPEA